VATSWTIQVLTLDYLVEGLFDDSNDNHTAMYFFRSWYDDNGKLAISASIHLTKVHIQTMRNATPPVSSAAEWWSFSNNLIAIIPSDENSLAYVVKNNVPKSVISADVFVGPYRIHGSVLCPDKQLSSVRYYLNFVVQDAEILCLDVDAKLPSLQVPYAIVRTHLVQGIVRDD